MNDPPRLCHDINPRIAALLRAGQDEPHPDRDLQRALAAVGSAGAVIGASQSAAAVTAIGKVGAWSLAKWAGAGLVSGLVTLGGAQVAERLLEPEPAPASASPGGGIERSPAPPVAATAHATTARVPAHDPPRQQTAPDSPASRAATPARAAPPRPVSSAPSPDSMIIEVQLIDEARRALGQGRPREALAALGRYHAEAPTRRLAPEARYLEMEAYLAAGNTAAARRAAATLLERHPGGPHSARARWVLGDQTKALGDH
jgi:hypothetical protein